MSNTSKATHQSKTWGLSVFHHMCNILIALSLGIADTFCSEWAEEESVLIQGIFAAFMSSPSPCFQPYSLFWLVFCCCAPCQVSLAYSSPWVKPGLGWLLHSLHGNCSLAEPETQKSSCWRRSSIASCFSNFNKKFFQVGERGHLYALHSCETIAPFWITAKPCWFGSWCIRILWPVSLEAGKLLISEGRLYYNIACTQPIFFR